MIFLQDSRVFCRVFKCNLNGILNRNNHLILEFDSETANVCRLEKCDFGSGGWKNGSFPELTLGG